VENKTSENVLRGLDHTESKIDVHVKIDNGRFIKLRRRFPEILFSTAASYVFFVKFDISLFTPVTFQCINFTARYVLRNIYNKRVL
jgi:hypothetical protein